MLQLHHQCLHLSNEDLILVLPNFNVYFEFDYDCYYHYDYDFQTWFALEAMSLIKYLVILMQIL
jgi:hypothetical protein